MDIKVPFYRLQRICEGYVFTCVCLSTGGGLPQCILGYRPPGAGTPQNRHPPEQATPSKQTATVADGTHPTGMHSCFHNIIACTYKSTCAYITQWEIINTLKQ